PYRAVYQSGPLSLAYRFGLPVIATRLGSFEAEVLEEVTGVFAEPENPRDLARAIRHYFDSDLYRQFDETGRRIRQIGLERNSWDQIGQTIAGIYAKVQVGTVNASESALEPARGSANADHRAPRATVPATCSGAVTVAGSRAK